jgi:prepilin-type N-terminal cleavage/methylation domain-containing protein
MDREQLAMTTTMTTNSRGSVSPKAGPVRRSLGAGGFTLLEILIAMSILAVAMLGIIKMQMMGGTAIANSRNLSAATNLCRGKIEDIRKIRSFYVAVAGAPVQTDPDLVDPEAGATNDLADWTNPDHRDGGTMNENGGANGNFTRMWNVVDNLPAAGIKTVRVRVAWTEGRRSRYVDLETQVARKNLDYYN